MPSTTSTMLGERARAARLALGLNQDEIAERIGISSEVYGRIERGLVTPRIDTLLKLCSALQVEPNDLLLPNRRNAAHDSVPPYVRQLAALLDGADQTTIRRVVDVTRWLRSAPNGISRASERGSGTARRRR